MDVLSDKSVFASKWLSLRELIYKDRGGKEHKWTYASRGNNDLKQSDAVIVVPFVKHVSGEYGVLLVSEYRPVVGQREWAFPAGLIDPGEQPVNTAERELLEETGFKVMRHFSSSMPKLYTSAGLTDETFTYAFVEAVQVGKPKLQDAEDIEIKVHSLEDVRDLMSTRTPMSGRLWPVLQGFLMAGVILPERRVGYNKTTER